MKSSNPFFKDNVMETAYSLSEGSMTVQGTINKLLFLSLVLIASASVVYYQYSLQHFDFVSTLSTIGIIGAFITIALVLFLKKITPIISIIYTICQGFVLSAVSCFAETQFPGIVIKAVSMTFIVVLSMALLYKVRLICATAKTRATISIATFAIFIFYLITWLLSSVFHVNIPYFSNNSLLNIAVNAVIALVAAFNLILDFDFIENGANRLPKSYEWYGAHGLMVTIIWLYFEILRILTRLADRMH